MKKHTRTFKVLLSALEDLLEDHKRMFPEAHPNSTIRWDDCVEVRNAKAALKLANQNPG